MAVAIRAVLIQVFPPGADRLRDIANSQYHEEVTLAPYRGSILDRRSQPLAISTRLPSVYVNPRMFKPTPAEVQRMARILRIRPDQIAGTTNRRTFFAWLARRIPKANADELMNLKIRGVSVLMEPARFYPSGSAASQVLGFVGIDDKGLMGLEKQFDKDLRGQPMTFNPAMDGRGRAILFDTEIAAPEKAGHDLHVTIDKVIQEIAEEALEAGVKKARAHAGFAVVSDPHTGRIIAMASYPGFDPNSSRGFVMDKARNRAIQDVFEPGSVVKTFVVAQAMESGKTRLDTIHSCEKGFYRDGPVRIRDDHGKDQITTAEVLIHSNNICTYKIAKSIGRERLHAAFQGFGFGARSSDLGFPGQELGRLSHWSTWIPVRFSNVAFGQGFTATALEVVQAYGAIANGGQLMRPYTVEKITNSKGAVVFSQSATVVRQAMRPETAKALRNILSEAVTKGTGSRAATLHYSTGGKTGTSEKVDPLTKAYSQDKRLASFVGFSPVKDPHIVVYVGIDEPREKPYYGGMWAAPVFSEITERTLRYLNVAPDKEPEALRVSVATKERDPTQSVPTEESGTHDRASGISD